MLLYLPLLYFNLVKILKNHVCGTIKMTQKFDYIPPSSDLSDVTLVIVLKTIYAVSCPTDVN